MQFYLKADLSHNAKKMYKFWTKADMNNIKKTHIWTAFDP